MPVVTERTQFELLMSEASLGLSFLDDADQVTQPDRKWRALLNAREALRSVKERMLLQALPEARAAELHAVVHGLERRLSAY